MVESSSKAGGTEDLGGRARAATWRVWAIVRELGLFVGQPRTMVVRRRRDWSQPAPATGVLAASAAAFVALWGLYSLAFGPFLDHTLGGQRSPVPAQVDAPSEAAVVIVDWGLSRRPGILISLPEALSKPASQPQRLHLTGGMAFMVLDGVVPSAFGSGALPFLVSGLLALLGALFLHPCARWLGGEARFFDALRLFVIYCAYAVVAVSLILLSSTLLWVHGLGLEGRALATASSLSGQLLAFLILSRGYLDGFAELYRFRRRRLAVASLGALVLSFLGSPVVFLPTMFVLVRCQPLLDLFA